MRPVILAISIFSVLSVPVFSAQELSRAQVSWAISSRVRVQLLGAIVVIGLPITAEPDA